LPSTIAASRRNRTTRRATARVLYFTYDEYETRWDEIAKVFSKEAILQGSFDKFAETGKGKRGTSPVDAQFLAEIESWREALAKNLALRNPRLSVRDLNFAVQRTIDRIIFLRMCEDRGVEHYAQLQALLNGEHTYKRLQYLYGIADEKYNSGLFHFREEKERAEAPDELTLKLKIDDKVLKDIIRRLYYPESPYEFSVLTGDILGNVYEQFLGKVIRLTAGHHAVVEEKPEVKKAGGVYYTPAYIVDYIVKNTVGKLCEAKSPKQIEKLRILDPACGSGSFLIGAYTSLLDYHRDWYVKQGPEKHAKVIYQGAGGHWYLTTQEKKRILLNNIYGVDIDSQAVEVTKLSLLLKVLEGESEETIGKTLKLFRERALPDLGNNIKCGNSLIGPDFHKNKQMSLLGDEDRYRINAFDWHSEFPDMFPSPSGRGTKGEGEGGFDAVIGNPPYVRIQALQEWAPIEVQHYKSAYKSAGKGNYDLYVVFVEKGLSLLNKNGRLGFILPHKFFNAQYGEPLRDLISKGNHLSEVVHFGDQQVFAGATTYTCLLFLKKAGSEQCQLTKVTDLPAWRVKGEALEGSIPNKQVTKAEWNFTVGKDAELFERLSKMSVKLRDVTDRIYQGPITSADTVYLFEQSRPGKKNATTEVFSRELNKWIPLESKILKCVVRSGDIGRYWATIGVLALFPYEVNQGSAQLISAADMERLYPQAWKYLTANKHILQSREKGKFRDAQWYRFGRTQNLGMWEQPKLMIPYMVTNLAAYLDRTDNYYFINVTTGGYGITTDESRGSLAYLCSLLNSRLLDFYFKKVSTTFHGGYFAANKQYIEQLPIAAINFADPTEKARHDKIVVLGEHVLDLHKKVATAKNPNDKTHLEREIEATDNGINQLVYELYGLTEAEIEIVETTRN
jgi:type I restriction-modification system DNA methylase subunit